MPVHYRIALTVVPQDERFSGRTEIDVRLSEPRDFIYLHGRDLNVTSAEAVTQDGTVLTANYEQLDESGVVRLSFEDTLPAGNATLRFVYDAPFNRALTGLYKIVDQGDSYAFSQLEPISGRRIFPSFDEPRFKTPFDLEITVRAEHEIVSNTTPLSVELLDGGMKRVVFTTTERLPTYLLVFAVGPLDIVEGPTIPANEVRDRPVPLRGITARGRGAAIRYALDNTPQIVAILERYFDTPYPFDKLDIIAAPDFRAGAMENAGAIVYRETLILMDENAPLRQLRGYAYVHAHELAHQWFGNLVTPRWWDDIWLNEAFATWMGHLATTEWFPDGEYDRDTLHDALWVMGLDSLPSARRIREPVEDPGGIFNAFDGITYSKGAGVLAMFENFLGAGPFQDGVRLHMERFAFGTASTEDFLTSLAEGADRAEVLPAFSSFIDQPGVPVVTVRSTCEAGSGVVSLSQKPYAPFGITPPEDRRWRVPVCLRALDGAADAGGAAARTCVMLDTAEAKFAFDGVCGAAPPAAAALMPNAGGQGYYRFALDGEGWRALLAAKDHLDAAEQVSVLDNLDAALRAGGAEAALLFEGLDALVPEGEWDVVDKATQILAALEDTVIEAQDRERFAQKGRELIGPRFAALGLVPRQGEAVGDQLQRHTTAWFLVGTAGDTALRAELAQGGRAYVASGGQDAAGLSPDLLTDALWSAVAEGGPDFGRVVIDSIIASTNAEYRRSALFALTAAAPSTTAADEAFLHEVNALMLSDDLRGNETTLLMSYLLGEPERYVGTWGWIKANIEGLEERLQLNRMAGVIRRLDGTCDAALRDELEAFFTPRLDRYDGAPRALALTLQSIERCLAFREAKGAEISAAVQGWN